MKNQKEKFLRYNTQEELFAALMRRHHHPFAGSFIQVWPSRIAKAIKHLAATCYLFLS